MADDAALAASLQAQEHFELEEAPSIRHLHVKDVLTRRVFVIFYAALDIVGLAALFLQLTPPGTPTSFDDLLSRLSPALLDEFFFWPTAGAMTIVVIGGVFGTLVTSSALLWLYACTCTLLLGGRCFLLFEMSSHESTVPRTTLLIDVLIATSCIMFDLSASESASRLALDFGFNRAAKRQARLAPRRTRSRPPSNTVHVERHDDRSRSGRSRSRGGSGASHRSETRSWVVGAVSSGAPAEHGDVFCGVPLESAHHGAGGSGGGGWGGAIGGVPVSSGVPVGEGVPMSQRGRV